MLSIACPGIMYGVLGFRVYLIFQYDVASDIMIALPYFMFFPNLIMGFGKGIIMVNVQ